MLVLNKTFVKQETPLVNTDTVRYQGYIEGSIVVPVLSSQ